jgi:hypothetical protein
MTVGAGNVLQIEAGHDCCSIIFEQPTNVSAEGAHPSH